MKDNGKGMEHKRYNEHVREGVVRDEVWSTTNAREVWFRVENGVDLVETNDRVADSGAECPTGELCVGVRIGYRHRERTLANVHKEEKKPNTTKWHGQSCR